MKILINRKPVQGPWGGGNLFVKSFCKAMSDLGHDVVHEFDDSIDLIFMQDPRYDKLRISINEIARYKEHRPSTRVIHRVNECDARKNTNDMDSVLRECSKISDDTIFVSQWMKNYHLSRGWYCKNNHVVYNGVNLGHFKPREKISNGKTNIVTHHWSSNPLKGSDVYRFLDDFVGKNEDYTFTYIGRSDLQFKNSKLISPIYGEDLGKELSRYDVYVSGSRHDPGPNHIIESIACNLPTLCHTDGGGAVEFCGKKNTFDNFPSLVKLIQAASRGQDFEHDLNVYDWKSCMHVISKILNEKSY
jgi:hypothetical protein